jgi:hypothetical protein
MGHSGLSYSLSLFIPKKAWVMARLPEAPTSIKASEIEAPLKAQLRVVFLGASDPLIPATQASGDLLAKMISAMGLKETDFAIDPSVDPDGAENAEVIVTLGKEATESLLGNSQPFEVLRGKFQGRILPTFHPSELLSRPELKKDAWADLKQVMKKLGIG